MSRNKKSNHCCAGKKHVFIFPHTLTLFIHAHTHKTLHIAVNNLRTMLPHSTPCFLVSSLLDHLIWYLDWNSYIFSAWMCYEQQKEDWPSFNQLCVCLCMHLMEVDAPLHNPDEPPPLASNHRHISCCLSSFRCEERWTGITELLTLIIVFTLTWMTWSDYRSALLLEDDWWIPNRWMRAQKRLCWLMVKSLWEANKVYFLFLFTRPLVWFL